MSTLALAMAVSHRYPYLPGELVSGPLTFIRQFTE